MITRGVHTLHVSNTPNSEVFYPHLAISEPLLIFSIVSSIITVLVFSYAIILIRSGKQKTITFDVEIATKKGPLFDEHSIEDTSNLLTQATLDWESQAVEALCKDIMTQNEFTVFKTMFDFLIQDGVVFNQKNPPERNANSSEGFRNKHKIIKASGVEQGLIYNPNGILERFVELKILEEKEPPTGWGGQKNVYRVNIEHQLAKAYLNTILNDR